MWDGRRLVEWHLTVASTEGAWDQKHQMSKLKTSNIFKLPLSRCKEFPERKRTEAIFTIFWRSGQFILEQSGQEKSSASRHYMHADQDLLSSRSVGLLSPMLVQSWYVSQIFGGQLLIVSAKNIVEFLILVFYYLMVSGDTERSQETNGV